MCEFFVLIRQAKTYLFVRGDIVHPNLVILFECSSVCPILLVDVCCNASIV